MRDDQDCELGGAESVATRPATYAHNQHVLEEVVSGGACAAVKLQILATVALVATYAVLICLAGALLFGARPFAEYVPRIVLELGVVAGLWGAPILLRPWVPSVRLPQTIRVENGHLTISGPFRTRSVPLSECRWFEAYTIHDPALEGAPVAPCIGIYARKLLNARWHRKYRPHISVGLSENTRDVWRALLTSAGIPKGRRRRRHEQWIVLTGVLVGFALARGAYAVISAQEEFEPAALLIAYLSHVIAPVIGAVYASVLAGNDWYAEEKGIASILVFGLLPLPAAFACLLGGAGMQTTLIYVGGSSLLALAFGVEITRRR